MSRAARPPRGPSHVSGRGFVLIGVLMFILILTVLGLSLFSLSSFESQFFIGSLDQQRAFYSATGGIERAKFVLGSTGRLPDARNVTGVPLEGLVYTVAKQGDDFASADSNASVNWASNAKPVWIRSLAVIGGQRAMVEAQFMPHRGRSFYKRLFTLSSPLIGLDVRPMGGQPPPPPGHDWSASDQVFLSGEAWQNASNTLPANIGMAPTMDMSGGVPQPDVASYFTRFWSAAPTMAPNANDTYVFDGYVQDPTDHVGFWKTPYSGHYDSDGYWCLNSDLGHNPGDAQIQVRGTCVWMFDHGVRWNRHVVVLGSGNADDALVIVAHPGSDDVREAGRGIVLNQPLYSAQAPVILVSDGGVGDENTEDAVANSVVTYLSVFAATCGLIGPKGGGHSMSLTHAPGAPQDTPITGLIDRLSKKGYLPNTSGAGGDFIPIAGKWREIKDSDPIN